MTVKLITWSLLFCVPLYIAPVVAEQLPPLSVVGRAFDRGSGHFVYSENHFCDKSKLLCTVQYRNSAGVLFAKKDLDYRSSLTAPSVVTSDYRRNVDSRTPTSQREGLVVDAGFDNYVRSIWDVLDGGNKTKFPFLVAGFDKPIRMTALRSDTEGCSPADLCLKISLDSWLLGRLIAPIELSYSRADRRLRRFSGISNIKKKDGGSMHVDIHYQYDGQLLIAGPAEHNENAEYKF